MVEENLERSLLVGDEAQVDGGEAAASSGFSSVTPVLALSILVTAAGSVAFGCAAGFSSPAEFGIMKDLGLSTAQYSVFGTSLTIGAMLGASVNGKVADLIGRKATMGLIDVLYIMGWLAIIFGKGAYWLDIGRLSQGMAVGLSNFVGSVYITEIAPKNIRGACCAASEIMVCTGLSVMFFIGNIFEWRTLALIGIAPCLLQIIGLFFIPESPRWLAKVGREKELEQPLQRLRGKNTDISREAAEIRDYTEAVQLLSESSFLDLFQRRYAHALIVGVGLMLLVQFGGVSGVSFYASSIFRATGCSVEVGTTAMSVIQIPFSVAGMFLIDTIGRRSLLMLTATGASLGCLLAGLAFLLQDLHQQKELSAILVLTGILIYFGFVAMGMSSTPWIIMSEIFPMNVKGSAGSFVTLVNWFTSSIVSYVFSFLFQWNSAGVFFIFATTCASIVLFAAKVVPETKGRTLEAIQASMIDLFK